MLDYLMRHAVDNVWCSPEQDRQSIIRLARISPDFGAISHQQVMWEDIKLPTKADRYDVYQIGHIHPRLLGLMTVGATWTRLSEVIDSTVLMSEVYITSGIIYPRSECWVRFDRHRNLIMAIKQLSTFPTLKNETLYFRVYSNAFFNSTRSDMENDGTTTYGRVVVNVQDVLTVQQRYHTAKTKEGAVFAFHNGRMVSDFIPGNIESGDYIEYVHDTSVYRVVDFPVNSLGVFDSTLDGKQKYLLNPVMDDHTTIDFEDDIDLYLIEHRDNGQFVGVYYHRNQKDAIRMVTHKDYSIPVSTVDAFEQDHVGLWEDGSNLTVRLYIRKAGFKRPLIFDSHRIFELYRMSPDNVSRAMLGIDSTVPEWRAETLENSAYVKLMRNRNDHLDPVQVQQAYGYNSISRLFGNSPLVVDQNSGVGKVVLPVALQENVTVYEYDKDGLLLGRYYHEIGLQYTCRNNDASLVEIIGGEASQTLGVVFGETSVEVSTQYNYRAYLCTLFGQEPAWDWVDVSNADLLSVGMNQLNLNIDSERDYSAIVSDRRFLGYDFTMDDKNGVYKFTLSSYESHFGETNLRVMTIPFRRLDLWLNGHSLIEGLDYYVKFPDVTIVNKTYLLEDDPQHIEVRGTGFCTDEMKMEPQREVGFVEHGYLSHDKRYDVRDDKVLSVVVNGCLTSREALSFAEDNLGVAIPGVANGSPYSLRETVVPLKGSTYIDTYQFRDRAMEVDQRIADYLTLKYPQPDIAGPSPIAQRYMVYSPFLSRIVSDLREDLFDEVWLQSHYSNADVMSKVEDYKYLLEFDPGYLGVDDRYVFVHPHRYAHAVDVDVYEFNFIKRVVQLYFNDKIPLSHFFTVTMPQLQE